MSNNYCRLHFLKLCCAALLMIGSTAIAQESSGEAFSITHHTIDNGGGVSQGGQFSLTGTTGQMDADESVASGGQFSLRGGFWSTNTGDLIFRDNFESP